MDWVTIKAIIGLIGSLIGLYHWIKLSKNGDAAYHAGNAVMYTFIGYRLMDGLSV